MSRDYVPDLDPPRTSYGRTCGPGKRRNLEALWAAGWLAVAGSANRRWWHPQYGEQSWHEAVARVARPSRGVRP